MGLIKLPDVPDELHKRLKAEAASYGITLVMYCIGKLGGTLPTPLASRIPDPIKLKEFQYPSGVVHERQTVQVRIPQRWPVSDPNKIHSCSECGAMSGVHQKWCKGKQ